MTAKRREAGRRGRPPVHDPDTVARLLAERASTGESYAALSERSGIPIGTLSGHASRRRASHRRAASRFLEIVATDGSRDAIEDGVDDRAVPASFGVIVDADEARRHVIVPVGFDAQELRRLVAALESRC